MARGGVGPKLADELEALGRVFRQEAMKLEASGSPLLDTPPAYNPRNTKAVPAHIRPMLKGRPAAAMRCRVRLSPITTKPAKVKMFIPKRMSLVNIAPYYYFWGLLCEPDLI